MESEKHLIKVVLLSFLTFIIGTSGYMIIEGWNLIDAIYMTVITLTTVGYGEVKIVSTTGRIFTIFLIVVGCGQILYVAGVVVQYFIDGRIKDLMGRRKLDNKISKLKNHIIVCGYGRIGRVISESLREKREDVVVVEKDETLIKELDESGVLYITGDATDEENLIKAGIHRAEYLVAALATDSNNVFLVLTARQLNPHIFIMARAGNYKSKSKLITAGADKVEYPYDMGAFSMAMGVLRPTVTSFLDIAMGGKDKKIQIEEISVQESSSLVNVMLKDTGIRQKYELIIIAIKKEDGGMLFNPSFDTTIHSGDTVIAVGEKDNLIRLEKALNPKSFKR
ncbi:MAG: potassium channel protein [Desulfobacterales bacterium]|nr:potassium channel protein [Desulfobacterales bacterium]MCP4162257.1 potassium channel protein [Deltaproteobacteria bacterium]